MTVMVLALATAMQAGGAPSVEIENFIGTVRVEQGATLEARYERGGSSADIRNANAALTWTAVNHAAHAMLWRLA